MNTFKGEKKMKNGWQICIDLTGEDQEENLAMLGSPIFETEEEADNWYRGLEIDESEIQRYGKGLDLIMVQWINDEITESYII